MNRSQRRGLARKYRHASKDTQSARDRIARAAVKQMIAAGLLPEDEPMEQAIADYQRICGEMVDEGELYRDKPDDWSAVVFVARLMEWVHRV